MNELFDKIVFQQYQFRIASKHLHAKAVSEIKKDIRFLVNKCKAQGFTLDQFKARCIELGASNDYLRTDRAHGFTKDCFNYNEKIEVTI